MLGWITAAAYAFAFLRLPVAEGLTIDGEAVSRAGFLIGSLLYPEGFVDYWFDQGRLPAGFLDRAPIALGTVLWLALAGAIGLPLVERVLPARVLTGPGWALRIEQFSWAALVGLALLSTATLLVGLAGGLHSRVPLLVAIGLLAALLYGWSWLERRKTTSGMEPLAAQDLLSLAGEPERHGLLDRACVAVTVGLSCWSAAVVMLGAWVPASEFDVLEYHLQAPKEFYQLGAVRFLPHNVYANMPLGTEMHTLAMMTLLGQTDPWLGGLLGKSITAAFSILGAALLGGYLARRLGSLCGWWAAGLWLAMPGIAHAAMLGLIDGAVATYVLAAALAAWRAIEALRVDRQLDAKLDESALAEQRSRALGWWGSAGILAGAAAAAKYPGLLFAVVPAGAELVLAVWLNRFPGQAAKGSLGISLLRTRLLGRDRWLATGLFALGLAATCMPWYAKNWVQAGNPVYPLAANIFGGRTLTAAKIEQWQRAHRVPPAAPPEASAIQRVVASVRVAGTDLARLGLTSPYVQPAIICGLGIAVGMWLSRRYASGTPLGLWLAWSMWIVAVWWLATHRIDRFWLPLSGLWAASSALGLAWLRSRGMPWLAHAIVIVGLVYGGLFNSSSLVSDNRFFVSLNALRTDATTDEQVGRVPAEQAWINEHLPASGTRVLLIGEADVFEYRVPILYSTCFDANPGEAMLRGKTPAEQTAALHEHGITHIMINWGEIARYRSPGNYGFSDWPQPADIEQMIASGVLSRIAWPLDKDSVELLKVN
ncbi:MAG: hypothetical protein ACTHK7_23705 [Aureliella sp.]